MNAWPSGRWQYATPRTEWPGSKGLHEDNMLLPTPSTSATELNCPRETPRISKISDGPVLQQDRPDAEPVSGCMRSNKSKAAPNPNPNTIPAILTSFDLDVETKPNPPAKRRLAARAPSRGDNPNGSHPVTFHPRIKEGSTTRKSQGPFTPRTCTNWTQEIPCLYQRINPV